MLQIGGKGEETIGRQWREPESLIKVQIFTTVHTNNSKEAESNQPTLGYHGHYTEMNFEKGAQIGGFCLVEKHLLYSPRVTLAAQLSAHRH